MYCVACIRLCFIGLVKYSNEGGPGPRYNMKEDPGSSTLIMLVVHAYHPYPMPLFSEAGDQKTSSVGLPPPSEQPGQGPLPPPSSTYSTPCKDASRDQARWKSHFSLWFEVGGHILGQRWVWRPFWAFPCVCTRSGSWAGDQRRSTRATSLKRASKAL